MGRGPDVCAVALRRDRKQTRANIPKRRTTFRAFMRWSSPWSGILCSGRSLAYLGKLLSAKDAKAAQRTLKTFRQTQILNLQPQRAQRYTKENFHAEMRRQGGVRGDRVESSGSGLHRLCWLDSCGLRAGLDGPGRPSPRGS